MPRESGDSPFLVREISPRSGDPISVSAVTAFVGSNASGGGEVLRDILRLAANFDGPTADRDASAPETQTLRDVTLHGKLTLDRLLLGLSTTNESAEEITVRGFGPEVSREIECVVGQDIKNILRRPSLTARSVVSTALGDVMPLRALYLKAADRTTMTAACPVNRTGSIPQTLLQALLDADRQVHERLDEAFRFAFRGEHICLDDSSRVELSLRTAGEFPQTTSAAERYQQLALCRRLDEIGYEAQSFVAVVLSTLVSPGRFILVEEPELHLHPETARRLGEWLAGHIAEQSCQLFLNTNSEPFLAGLFDQGVSVTLVHATSASGATHLTAIEPATAAALGTEPQLAHQHALSCVFSDGIAIVPDTVDALIYEAVSRSQPNTARVRFLHALGQQNLPTLAALVRKIELPVAIVTGLEVFENEADFCELVEAASGEETPRPWLATRERLAAHLEKALSQTSVAASAQEVEEFLEQYKNGEVAADRPTPQAAMSAKLAWRQLSAGDLQKLPPELASWVDDLLEDLKQRGIYVAPKPISSWFQKEADGQSGSWLERAFKKLRAGETPADLVAFVNELNAIANQPKHVPRRLSLAAR